MLYGKKIFLRTVHPSDAAALYCWENNFDYREAGSSAKHFTKEEIKNFVLNSYHDIHLEKQLRWMICPVKSEKKAVNSGSAFTASFSESIGCIDLFDFDEHNRKAGVGILIAEPKHRKNGYGSEALSILVRYCFSILHLKQLYCTIAKDNRASLNLFTKHGFKISRTGKNQRVKNGLTDVCFLQLFNKNWHVEQSRKTTLSSGRAPCQMIGRTLFFSQ